MSHFTFSPFRTRFNSAKQLLLLAPQRMDPSRAFSRGVSHCADAIHLCDLYAGGAADDCRRG